MQRIFVFLFLALPAFVMAEDSTRVKRFIAGPSLDISLYQNETGHIGDRKNNINGINFGINFLYKAHAYLWLETGIHYRQYGYNTNFQVFYRSGGFGNSHSGYSWKEGHVHVKALHVPLKINYIFSGKVPFFVNVGGDALLFPLITYHHPSTQRIGETSHPRYTGLAANTGTGAIFDNDLTIVKTGISIGYMIFDNRKDGTSPGTYDPEQGITFVRPFISVGITTFFKVH